MNIFVAKLSRNTRADDLSNLFSQFGEVLSAKIIVDRATGASKGYAFIEMAVEEEGEAAISALNETTFMNSVIVVKKAHPREEIPTRKPVLRKRIQPADDSAEKNSGDADGNGEDDPVADDSENTNIEPGENEQP